MAVRIPGSCGLRAAEPGHGPGARPGDHRRDPTGGRRVQLRLPPCRCATPTAVRRRRRSLTGRSETRCDPSPQCPPLRHSTRFRGRRTGFDLTTLPPATSSTSSSIRTVRSATIAATAGTSASSSSRPESRPWRLSRISREVLRGHGRHLRGPSSLSE